MKKRLMTGFTPTGRLHLGHFVGNLENLLKLKDEYDEFLLLADTHAITTLNKDPKVIRQYALDNLLDMLSVGLSEDEVSYYIESEIPEIYELASLFSMFVTHSRALRNPTIKDEIKMKGLGDVFSLGFINYPMYQAADILCVKGELVPVGKDQEAHLEQSREIVDVFNKMAGRDFLPSPKTMIGRVGKLIGTDGNPKMSKSLGNTIYLSATPEEVENKVMNMYTDPTRLRATDPGHVEGNPVFIYLDAFSTEEDKEKIGEYKELYTKGQVGDVEVKKYLVTVLNKFMDPIRQRREAYNNEERLLEIARTGTQRAREETQQTLKEVKEVLGLVY
jgi:tryptophanyl-tRNA synthetase